MIARLAFACLILIAGCGPRVDDRSRLYTEDGVQLFATGDYRNALESFELALTLNPQDAGLLYNVAECHDRLGHFPRADQYYSYCLQLAPGNADARLGLVALYYRSGKVPEANRLIAEYLSQNPSSADALVLDAFRLRQEKDLPDAQARLQQALEREPHNRRARSEMAYIYESMGMPERAYVLYERILKDEPKRDDIAARLKQLQASGVSRPLRDP